MTCACMNGRGWKNLHGEQKFPCSKVSNLWESLGVIAPSHDSNLLWPKYLLASPRARLPMAAELP